MASTNGPTTSHLRPDLLQYGAATNLSLNEAIQDRIKNGEEIFHMGFGQSPFPVFHRAVQALQNHAGENSYLPVSGIKELRHAIADFHEKVDGIKGISSEDIIVGPGTKQLSFLLLEVFNGDVYLPSPCWTTYKPQANLAHKQPIILKTSAEDGWKIDPQMLDEEFSKHSQKNKILILTNPDNPTGTTYTPEENEKIANVCRKDNAFILSDEIYSLLNYEQEHDSIYKHYPEGTILQNGLSKWAAAGGWRLGYQIYPANLSILKGAVRSGGSHTHSCASAPVQYAALEYFKFDSECQEYVSHCRRILKAVSEHIYFELTSVGVKVVQPKGGFYMMPDFEILRDSLKKRRILNARQMQDVLLEECSVTTIACGPAFLRPENEFTFRLCYINFDGEKALEASRKIGLDTKLTEEFLRENCSNTLQGVDALKKWTLEQLKN